MAWHIFKTFVEKQAFMGKSSRQLNKSRLFIKKNTKRNRFPNHFTPWKYSHKGRSIGLKQKWIFPFSWKCEWRSILFSRKFSQKSPKQQIFHSSACICSCLAQHIFARIFAKICTSGEKFNGENKYFYKNGPFVSQEKGEQDLNSIKFQSFNIFENLL